ncbi:unnamed protein product [Coffea canephora]|uniref:Leucine-rich repeat-containing N-terminal plant-type domain-containing protein n=1 Tax=Coffea canephora TaxID=49390 RepID=A0A068VFQ0_COFCA|nr:unnamed protein product [Coffea canephora]
MWGLRSSTLANIFLLLSVAMNFSISHASSAKQFQNETGRLALLEFKNQIYDDPFGALNSWNHSQQHCRWEGVTCGARHQRVIALTLRSKQLSGTIAPHVGNLSFMRSIQLGDNQFHGEISQEFGRLFRLRVLNLSSNAISGKIPANLSYCSELVTISLAGNNLEGKIPMDQLSNLKKLENFFLYKNNLTGEIPSSIGNLSSLTQLDFDFNNLEGSLPLEMGLLKRLVQLFLAANKLSGIIPASIFNSSAITVISVGANYFHGNLPINMGLTLPNLEELGVGANKFYGNFPTSITNASGLKVFDLSENNFKGQIPANLGDLTQLKRVNLGFNFFGSNSTGDLDFIASLTNCSNLRILSLSANKFGGNVPKIMANQLTELFVGGNQLSGTIPQGFGNFVNLIQLGLEVNSFSGIVPRDFGKLPNLQGLRLDHNDFSGQLVSTLCNNTNLFYLDLSFNQFEGGNIFDNMKIRLVVLCLLNLESLYIWWISMFPTINLLEIYPSHLLIVQIWRIFLCRPIFSKEQFHQILASWKSIQQLDLSSNNLTGPIPKELEKLQYLRYLNLSYNDIEGEIPKTGIFSNASQISLIGNNKLCGGIPELEFPPCPVIKGKNRGKLKLVAVKVLDLQKNGASKSFKAECKALRNIRHRNLVSIQGTGSTIAIKGSIGYAAPEYGMGLAVSTQGDVYSYGILLLEMITGRRPTDDIFVGDLDLHNYVNGALREQVSEIVDPNMTPGEETINGGREIDCIISLLKVGLKCSARLPNDRMHMNEVVRKLHLIKDVFLGVRVHQENFEA